MLRVVVAALAIVALSACNFPRGGASKQEIFREANKPDTDMALYHVDQTTMDGILTWSSVGRSQSARWISHRHNGAGLAVRPHDFLEITIWDSDETSLFSSAGKKTSQISTARVTEAGLVFLPFVGNVHVAGLSEGAARNKIQRKFSELAPSSQVQLSVVKGVQASVSMVSGFARPAVIPIADSHFTILNGVASAGGVHISIENPYLRLVRKGKSYAISMADVLENPELDTVLQGGDRVSVEQDPRYFRVLGASSKEALFHFNKTSVSALDAVSVAGGFSERQADPKGVMVLREFPENAVRLDGSGPSNKRVVFAFDLTSADGLFSAGEFNLETKDTILVSESKIASQSAALLVLARLLGVATDIDSLLK